MSTAHLHIIKTVYILLSGYLHVSDQSHVYKNSVHILSGYLPSGYLQVPDQSHVYKNSVHILSGLSTLST